MSWKLGWVNTVDSDGGGERPDNELPGGGGGHPWLPGHGGGGRPDNELPGGGYVWGTFARLIKWLAGPHIDIKPPGAPILPVDPGWSIPVLPPHPWLPGSWIPVDPGYGKPPLWGFLPVDPGWSVGGVKPPTPDNTLPGHWVPVDPGYGQPIHGCAPPHPSTQPIWVWIAEIGPDFGRPKPANPIAGTPEPKK